MNDLRDWLDAVRHDPTALIGWSCILLLVGCVWGLVGYMIVRLVIR